MNRSWIAATAALLLVVGSLGAQAPAEPSMLDRLLDAARNGSPVVRPQAAQRLVGLGDEAGAGVLALLDEEGVALADLGQDLIEVLGRLGSQELRSRLWLAIANPDFPWRPAAARSLAASIEPLELSRASVWLGDPLASVRAAGVAALDRLDARSHEDRLDVLLRTDPNDRVRRDIAVLFDRWGKRWALAWIVVELERTDTFFDQDTGRAARFDAVRRLEQQLGHPLGIRPEQPASAPENAEAYAQLRDEVKALAGGRWPKLPDVARVGTVVPPAVLGIEVRSCRAGEHFVRFTADDGLWLGTGGNPLRVALEPGTVAGLLDRVGAGLAPLEGDFWGQPGCDSEQLYLRNDPEVAARIWRVSKGAEPIEGLRPAALSAALAALVAAVPDEVAGAPARPRLALALAAVGGRLEVRR